VHLGEVGLERRGHRSFVVLRLGCGVRIKGDGRSQPSLRQAKRRG
jgi:hypothetical protein